MKKNIKHRLYYKFINGNKWWYKDFKDYKEMNKLINRIKMGLSDARILEDNIKDHIQGEPPPDEARKIEL